MFNVLLYWTLYTIIIVIIIDISWKYLTVTYQKEWTINKVFSNPGLRRQCNTLHVTTKLLIHSETTLVIGCKRQMPQIEQTKKIKAYWGFQKSQNLWRLTIPCLPHSPLYRNSKHPLLISRFITRDTFERHLENHVKQLNRGVEVKFFICWTFYFVGFSSALQIRFHFYSMLKIEWVMMR